MLVKQLFGISKSINKRAFWTLYGDIVYNNLCRNIDENYIQCERCKTRFYVKQRNQTVCDECLCQEIERKERLKKNHKKVVKCCDCGEEFDVDIRNMKKIRCDNCQREYRKQWDRNRKTR